MENGCIGTMTASWTCYGAEDNSTILYGTKGVMKIYSDPAHSIVVELKGGEKICYDLDKIQTNDNQTKSRSNRSVYGLSWSIIRRRKSAGGSSGSNESSLCRGRKL